MMFIDFNEFTTNTLVVVGQVLEFVGADPALLKCKTLPPSMQVGRWVGGGWWARWMVRGGRGVGGVVTRAAAGR
jgi:hypothetical protein